MEAERFDRDLDLVVGLWQGGEDPGLADGADALAAAIAAAPRRERIRLDLPSDPAPAGGIRNLAAVSAHLDAAREQLGEYTPERLLTLGGDCTVAVAPGGYLLERHPELRVVWIDTHADLHSPGSSTSGLAYGMPLRALFGEGHPALTPRGQALLPERTLLVGTYVFDDGEADWVKRHGPRVVGPQALASLPEALAAIGPERAPALIHLDLDVLDPDEWPAVEVPTPGGLSIDSLALAIAAIRSRFDVIGITITEHVPDSATPVARLNPVLEALGLRD